MAEVEPRREVMGWIGPVLEEALGTDSQIMRSFRADELPSIFTIAENSLVGLAQNHPDRELMVVATIYLALGALLLDTDLETSDREQVAGACAELGRLGAWLAKAKPQTLARAKRLIGLVLYVLEVRTIAPELPLREGRHPNSLLAHQRSYLG